MPYAVGYIELIMTFSDLCFFLVAIDIESNKDTFIYIKKKKKLYLILFKIRFRINKKTAKENCDFQCILQAHCYYKS